VTETTGTAIDPRFHAGVIAKATFAEAHRGSLILESPEHIVLAPSHSRSDWIANEFRKHERKWKRETRHLSSPSEKYLHPSYARIIGLGWPAVALILRSLRRERDDWFYALRALTGANPVTAAMAGDMVAMTAAWLAWGQQHGVL
jgi:hypothetical protein